MEQEAVCADSYELEDSFLKFSCSGPIIGNEIKFSAEAGSEEDFVYISEIELKAFPFSSEPIFTYNLLIPK